MAPEPQEYLRAQAWVIMESVCVCGFTCDKQKSHLNLSLTCKAKLRTNDSQLVLTLNRFCRNTSVVIKMWWCVQSSYWHAVFKLCFHITCRLVSADVKQASAPVSSRLCDGGDGCCGDAEARLCDHWVWHCGDIVRPPVVFAYSGGAPQFFLLKRGCYWKSRSEIRFLMNLSLYRWLINSPWLAKLTPNCWLLFSKTQSQNSNYSLFCDPWSSNLINFIHSANFIFLEQPVLHLIDILSKILANTNLSPTNIIALYKGIQQFRAFNNTSKLEKH